MTIKEMCKKIDGYNDIARVIRQDQVELRICVGYHTSVKVDSYKQLAKYLRYEYITEMANAILAGDYEFCTETEISIVDVFGDTLTEKVEFIAVTRW